MIDGFAVGPSVGNEVVGTCEGDAEGVCVGCEEVGDDVGDWLGVEDVGLMVGDTVGLEVVGA